jgi:hypothetical protein
MKNVHYVRRIISIVVMLYALSAFTVSAKQIKELATSTYCSDLTDTITPDSVAIKSFSAFADGKALIKVYTNDSELKVQLIAADEMTQQTWLFNGLTVYVDPTGKGSDKYAMTFPSAMSLGHPKMLPDNQNQEQQPGAAPPNSDDLSSPEPNQGQQPNRRPDISLIIQKMNLKGAALDIDGDTLFAGTSLAKVSLIDNQRLCYTIKLPYSIFNKKNLNPENISVGILSEFSLPKGNMGGPGGGMGGPGGGMGGPGGMPSMQRNSQNRFSHMQQPIKGWIQISVAHQ